MYFIAGVSKTFSYFLTFITLRRRLIYQVVISSSLNMSSASFTVKPPNVLVYTGEKSAEIYKNIAENLNKCFHVDKYIVYQLKTSQVLTTPWKENVALLVVFSEDLDKSIVEEFLNYVDNGGKLLVVCSNFSVADICEIEESNLELVEFEYENTLSKLHSGKYAYSIKNGSVLAADNRNNPIIVQVNIGKGMLITSTVQLVSSIPLHAKDYKGDCENIPVLKSLLSKQFKLEKSSSELPKLSSGYIIVDNDPSLENMVNRMTISEISLEKPSSASSNATAPLLFEKDCSDSIAFDKSTYYSSLKTDYFGRIVVFFPVITSTMYPAEQLSEYPGLVVIANRQLSGKGRSDNLWISPEGCAMFTLHFPLMLSSPLGQRLSILQHMSSLAVVHGLKKRFGHSDLNLSLKWPNDIYYGKDNKIGGVLVNTTIQGDVVHVYCGIGVNVANERPTTCINSIIASHNLDKGDSLPHFKTEEVIAIALTELENSIKDFTASGPAKFLDLYYKYWIHKDQRVSLADIKEDAIVEAIDDYGFLIVKTDGGQRLSLQPDGNRFDMMKNLIVSKEL